jgi:predicted ATP-grasp superfamily ATP-dependent carboligase
MRILVHEFVSGGGLAGREVPVSLAREGAAILGALLKDFAELSAHRIVTTIDPRFPLRAPQGVEVVILGPKSTLNELMASADAACLVAPETDGCLEGLAAAVEKKGRLLLGPGAAAVRLASDKAGLPRRLACHGLAHPPTRVVEPGGDGTLAAREVGFPLVVKPARGAGCAGVSLARSPRELPLAVEGARRASGHGPLLVQRYIPGLPASVSLLANGHRAVALAVNAQSVRAARPFSYRGGTTPLDHPLAGRAAEVAQRACEALPGLKGYIGVDVVLTETEAVVIEVNPRFTTSYLGVRSALDVNVASLALAACAGRLPAIPPARRRVRYTSGGRIVAPRRVTA